MSQEALLPTTGAAPGNRSLLRRMNSLGMLQAVLERPQSVSDLAASSGLSKTAVNAVMGDLVDLGWLEASDPVSRRRPGRPASFYRLAADLGLLLSLDIGANHLNAIATDLAGAPLGQATRPVNEADPAEVRIAAALDLTDALLGDLHRSREDLWAFTVGSPGVIDRRGGVTYFGGTGMPGWVGLNLRQRFGEALGCPVIVEGDVALGANAELDHGAARGRSDVIYVLCGRRTSSALIVGGRVHRGVNGAAGIVGELPQLRWAELNEQYGAHVLETPRPSRENIFRRAREGEANALTAVQEFADDLATGAAALVLALDPELVVVGGGSTPSADVFLPRMIETLGRLCPIVPPVVASPLGADAVALGGISLARERLLATLTVAVRRQEAFPGPAEGQRLLQHAEPE